MVEPIVLAALVIAFFFSFWNGFTDAANAIATIVGTRVLTPVKAVGLSAFGNFIGILFGVAFGIAVATTIGKGIINVDATAVLVIAALVGGLLYDVVTWFFGLPISESHVLIGGLVGAGMAAAGISGVNLQSIIDKVLIPMVTSPAIALIGAFFFTVFIIRLVSSYSSRQVNLHFGRFQILSSFFFSVTHGTNDAQKVIGLVTGLLVSQGYLSTFSPPFWVVLAAHASISLGTLFGGWRIVRTMAMKITNLRPYLGFCAETSGALVLAGTAVLGFPVSTTHAISGAIMGVGSVKSFSAVRWGVARRIIWAWAITIPASASLAYIVYNLLFIML